MIKWLHLKNDFWPRTGKFCSTFFCVFRKSTHQYNCKIKIVSSPNSEFKNWCNITYLLITLRIKIYKMSFVPAWYTISSMNCINYKLLSLLLKVLFITTAKRLILLSWQSIMLWINVIHQRTTNITSQSIKNICVYCVT